MNNAFILIIFSLFVFSCSFKKTEVDYIYLKNKYCSENEYCSVGIGKSLEEAKQRAKEELAQQIYSFVVSDFEKFVEIGKGKKKENKKLFIKTFTNIPLIDTKPYKIGKNGKFYFYVLKITKEQAQKLFNEYKFTFTALSYVDKIENTKDLSLKISLLKDLYKEIKLKNIEDKLFFSKEFNNVISFKSYVKLQLKKITYLLKAILAYNGVFIISKKDLSPVKGLKLFIILNGKEKLRATTDYKGFVSTKIKKPKLVDVYLDFPPFKESVLIERLYRKDSPTSKLYIYTVPKDLNFEVFDYSLVKEGITPDIVELKIYQKYKNFTVKIFSKDYEEVKEKIKLYRGYDYYLYKTLRKLRFGYVDLKTEGDAILLLRSANGKVITSYKDMRKEFKGKLPVGKYYVKVEVPKDNNYQIVQDNFIIYENSKIKRVYFEPQDRGYYRDGFGGGLFVSFLNGDFDIDYQCTSSFLLDCSDSFDLSSFGIFLKKFWNRFWGEIRLGFASMSKSNSSFDSGDSSGSLISLGGGFIFGKKVYFELGGGYLQLYSKYTSYNETAKVDIKSPYISLKVSLLGLGLEFRRTVGKNNINFVIFDLGGYSFKEGYKRPQFKNAIAGEDYEEN